MPRAIHSSHSRRLLALAIALLAAIVLAACGGSSGSSASSSSVSKTASTRATGATGSTGTFGRGANRRGAPYGGRAFRGAAAPAYGGGAPSSSVAACLRKHGVTVPQGGGPGGAGRPSGAGAPRGTGAPGGSGFAAAMRACGINFGRTYTPASAARRAAINRFAACMASNGDKLPTPNYSGNGAIFPASAEKSAKFKTAYAKCRSLVAATA